MTDSPAARRLPLALNLAGSLIKQLGIGRDWAGVPALIQDELKEGESQGATDRGFRGLT